MHANVCGPASDEAGVVFEKAKRICSLWSAPQATHAGGSPQMSNQEETNPSQETTKRAYEVGWNGSLLLRILWNDM